MTSDPIARYQTQRGARLSRAERLRPMSSNEVLDTAMRVYQRHGLAFLRLTALPSVFCLAAAAFVLSYVIPSFGGTQDASSIATQAAEVSGTLALAVFVAGPIFLTGLTYATSTVVRMVADTMNGQDPDELAAQREARKSLPRLFWLNIRELLLSLSGIIVATILMLVGSVLTTMTSETSVIAGIVALIGVLGIGVGIIIFLGIVSRDALAAPVSVIEGLSGGAAAKRSRALLERPKDRNPIAQAHGSGYGTIWNLYFILFLVALGLIGATETAIIILDAEARIGNYLAGTILKPIATATLELVPLYLTIWLLVPIWAATLTVVYYERRIRLEGYDIDCLAKQVKLNHGANRFNV